MSDWDVIAMSLRELKRLKLVHEVLGRQITQRQAAVLAGLSERQMRRLVRSVREEGDGGIVHRSRGRPSSRRLSGDVKRRVLHLYRRKYGGFGPTLASEKLGELDGIELSRETLRQWLLEAGLWKRRRRRSSHRCWRARRECFGEMLQMDGSHHDWLEGRGPALVLMGYIDDATNRVFGRFYDYEGTLPAMDSFKRYVRQYGLPQSVYLDRHTTYKSTKKLTVEEQLEGRSEPRSQFERSMEELGVEVIHAHSPQAKGRIERLFGVFQDRLIKEMRLQGIATKEAANEFLEGYLPVYSRRFGLVAANETDVHVRLPRSFDLDRYLCVKTVRTVNNDNTIAHDRHLYQIEERTRTKKVTVEQRVDGSLRLTCHGGALKYQEITERRAKQNSTRRPKPLDPPCRSRQHRKSTTEQTANTL